MPCTAVAGHAVVRRVSEREFICVLNGMGFVVESSVESGVIVGV